MKNQRVLERRFDVHTVNQQQARPIGFEHGAFDPALAVGGMQLDR